MTQVESKAGADLGKVFEERTREIFSLETNRERVGELAYNNFKSFFGCAQSILAAFQEVLGFKNDFWFKAIGGLHGGGGCGLTCGALAIGFILIHTRVGRSKLEEGFKGITPGLKPCQELRNWFKLMYKSTVCSEISGIDWFDEDDIIRHHSGPLGQETGEKCATLTMGTAYKVAEILNQL